MKTKDIEESTLHKKKKHFTKGSQAYFLPLHFLEHFFNKTHIFK